MNNKITRVLGVDSALIALGYSFYDMKAKLDSTGVFKTKGKGVSRLDEIRRYYKALIIHHKPEYIFIEGYAFGGRGQDMGEVGGLLRLLFFDFKLPFIEVVPQHLKMYTCGKGNARKELMLMKCFKRFDREFNDNNECDAYCLARFGAEMIEKGYKDFSDLYKIKTVKKHYYEDLTK